VLGARRASESASRAALDNLGVFNERRPEHLDEAQVGLRIGLRAKLRQLGGVRELLVSECAYEQWHRLLFARFLAENNLLLHPKYRAPVTLEECNELASELGEPDGWSVSARFAAEILPGIFQLDDPCVRLRLAPEGRDALERVLVGLPVEIFLADDALGWVYQYWQRDKKDEVNASERKIGGADLGPVTQLFTENYMVRFLLDNSLGAWWASRHPNSSLVKDFEYLRFDDDGKPAAGSFQGWPERTADITVMDPCCGSGHFLVEAFSMLWRMRVEEEGLSSVDAQDAVLRDNLFGLELDPRCVQIAMFNVVLQAWKGGGGWRVLPIPNFACSGIPVKAPLEEWLSLARGDERLENALGRLHALFRNADTLGSLIDPRRVAEQGHLFSIDYHDVELFVAKLISHGHPGPELWTAAWTASGLARAASMLARDYTIIATNVPYLGAGKQSDVLKTFLAKDSPEAKADLSTAFVDRWLRSTKHGGAIAVVSPQTWLFLRSFKRFRERLLGQICFILVARLGAGAFDAISGQVVQAALAILENRVPSASAETIFIDGSSRAGAVGKARALLESDQNVSLQSRVRGARQSVLAAVSSGLSSLLADFVDVHYGSKPGQTSRATRYFWEQPSIHRPWVRLESRPEGLDPYSGKREVILAPDAARMLGVHEYGVRGSEAWGRPGVLISKMTSLPSNLYLGEIFDDNAYVLVPRRGHELPAIFAFVRSADFVAEVRSRNQKLAIDTGAMVNVPIDFARWEEAATKLYPSGLPAPDSLNPTQWLFKGRLEESTAALHVAVARLLGYRWPDQGSKLDDLDGVADVDGIVCLPSVAGEQAAIDRLQGLLTIAFGAAWSPSKLAELLEQAGGKRKNLGEWLRDEFFRQHCALFANRPFIWHIWDGQREGFSALVNYHRLDRKMLEKLTYTYLGQDWAERQRSAMRDNVAGAEGRLAAALDLQGKLEAILAGEQPHDIYVRWKELREQPIGWEPDLNDGVRLNIRPFVEADVLRSPVNIDWKKDRGKNPDGSERRNDLHYSLADKQRARKAANQS